MRDSHKSSPKTNKTVAWVPAHHTSKNVRVHSYTPSVNHVAVAPDGRLLTSAAFSLRKHFEFQFRKNCARSRTQPPHRSAGHIPRRRARFLDRVAAERAIGFGPFFERLIHEDGSSDEGVPRTRVELVLLLSHCARSHTRAPCGSNGRIPPDLAVASLRPTGHARESREADQFLRRNVRPDDVRRRRSSSRVAQAIAVTRHKHPIGCARAPVKPEGRTQLASRRLSSTPPPIIIRSSKGWVARIRRIASGRARKRTRKRTARDRVFSPTARGFTLVGEARRHGPNRIAARRFTGARFPPAFSRQSGMPGR